MRKDYLPKSLPLNSLRRFVPRTAHNASPDLLRLPLTGSHLFYGDNLQILREHIPEVSVDLVYLDPLFNSDANYNVLFKAPTGEQPQAQVEAFEDTGTPMPSKPSTR